MGFLEIAAAMKFLSNVDLVWGAGLNESGVLNYGKIFTRELVLIIWVIIGLAIVTYVLGFFKFRHDSPVKKITPLRVAFAALFFGLCIYLTTGILGRKARRARIIPSAEEFEICLQRSRQSARRTRVDDKRFRWSGDTRKGREQESVCRLHWVHVYELSLDGSEHVHTPRSPRRDG
jgi:hypothetical protein